jgi:hypothetical protein
MLCGLSLKVDVPAFAVTSKRRVCGLLACDEERHTLRAGLFRMMAVGWDVDCAAARVGTLSAENP